MKELINKEGPISIARFMHEALYGASGYYKKNEIFGKNADFITSPELSQIFGEVIASFYIYIWQNLKIENLDFVEMGAGRGLFMQDMIRVAEKYPDFLKAADFNIVEISDRLIEVQKSNIDYNINFQNELYLNEKPIFYFANELLDAMPIYQFVKKDGEFFEKKIDYDNEYKIILDKNSSNLKYLSLYDINDIPNNAVIEISPQAINLVKLISNHIKKYSGIAVFIDYGYITQQYKDSLRSIKNHKYQDILSNISDADLTYDVDFYNLSKIAQGNVMLSTQEEFLKALGFEQRLNQLLPNTKNKDIFLKNNLKLIDPNEMGNFKVMIITSYDIKI